jgi:hypothetical protein
MHPLHIRVSAKKAFGQDDHVRMFGKDYAQRIARAGLKAEENEFARRIQKVWYFEKRNHLYRKETLIYLNKHLSRDL